MDGLLAAPGRAESARRHLQPARLAAGLGARGRARTAAIAGLGRQAGPAAHPRRVVPCPARPPARREQREPCPAGAPARLSAAGAGGPPPRRGLVGTGYLAPSVRPAHPPAPARARPVGRLLARGSPDPVGEERDQVAPQRPAGVGDADLVHPDVPAQPGPAPLRPVAGIPARPGRRGRRPAAGRRLRRCFPALGRRSRAPVLGRTSARRGLSPESEPGPVVRRQPDGLPGRSPPGGRPDPRPVALGRADRRAPRHLAAAAHPDTAPRDPYRRDPLR